MRLVCRVVEFSGLDLWRRFHLGHPGQPGRFHVRGLPRRLCGREMARFGGLSGLHLAVMCDGLVRQSVAPRVGNSGHLFDHPWGFDHHHRLCLHASCQWRPVHYQRIGLEELEQSNGLLE